MRANFGIDVDAFDLDEARLAIREDSACNRTLTLGGHNGHLNVAIKRAGLVLCGGGDLNATLFGDNRRRDHVHIRVRLFHDTRDD